MDWLKKLGSQLKIVACVEFLRGQQNAWPAGPRRGLRGPGGQACGRRPAALRKMGVYQTIAAVMVARCSPCEVANNLRNVAQFNRPVSQSNLFKSSPNAVVSLTGATASRLPSSCQSTHSLLAFVQCKTLTNLGVKFPPTISPN